MTRARSFVVACGALVAISACNAILGNEDRYYLAPDQCLLNSECDDGEICVFRTCSPPCREDVDCPLGARCLQTAQGTACVTTSASSCGAGLPCPDGTTCRDGSCRNECETDGECLADQACTGAGVCVGTDVTRDPDADTSGSGGAGGAPGAGGAAGTGGDSAAGASGAGAGGDSGGPCVARGAEDCFNGIDDDCDGALDCADAACDGPAVCVPEPAGARLGRFLGPGETSCPSGTSTSTLRSGLSPDQACVGCSCVPNESRCESGVYGHGTFACPSFQYSGLLYNVFSNRCDLLPADRSVHYFNVRGFTTCTAQGVGTPAPPSWAQTQSFCSLDRVGGGCARGQSCVPATDTPTCAAIPGDVTCGAGYPLASGDTWYEGLSDTRTCNCSCSFGSANCSGGYIEAWTGPNCTGTSFQLGNGAEGDSCALANTPASGRVVGGAASGGSCEPNAFPNGALTPTSPRTVCCR